MAQSKVEVSNKSDYDQAITDQRSRRPKPFYLKKSKINDRFVGVLTFTDQFKTTKGEGLDFGGDQAKAIQFLLDPYGATL